MEEEEEDDMVKEGLMASQREIFSISGPIHLTSIDWNNSYHRTSVASCLVQAVYTLERDRQQNRIGLKSQANHWWEFFNFTLAETLIDESHASIYGAVFEYKLFFSYNYHNNTPPRHVIAFCGTIMKRHSRSRDLRLDLRCVRDCLQDSTRFVHAIQVIQSAVAKTGNAAVWLAGHSLGAAVALLAGKIMTRSGFPLESYLFNPLFSSIPIEKLVKSEKLKHGVRFAGSLVKAGVAIAVKGRHHHDKGQEDDSFMKLASWIPYLYVNPSDPICSEYIGYFKHRNKMFEIGAGKIERIATRNSLRSLLSGGGGGSSSSDSSSEPLHLLPSAYMIINTSKSPDFKRAHGIFINGGILWLLVNMFCTSLISDFYFCCFKCFEIFLFLSCSSSTIKIRMSHSRIRNVPYTTIQYNPIIIFIVHTKPLFPKAEA